MALKSGFRFMDYYFVMQVEVLLTVNAVLPLEGSSKVSLYPLWSESYQ